VTQIATPPSKEKPEWTEEIESTYTVIQVVLTIFWIADFVAAKVLFRERDVIIFIVIGCYMFMMTMYYAIARPLKYIPERPPQIVQTLARSVLAAQCILLVYASSQLRGFLILPYSILGTISMLFLTASLVGRYLKD
jgi:hypothetical protein